MREEGGYLEAAKEVSGHGGPRPKFGYKKKDMLVGYRVELHNVYYEINTQLIGSKNTNCENIGSFQGVKYTSLSLSQSSNSKSQLGRH